MPDQHTPSARYLLLARDRAQPCLRCGAPAPEVVELTREGEWVLLGCSACRAAVAARYLAHWAPSLLSS
jgi:hypothetical protein